MSWGTTESTSTADAREDSLQSLWDVACGRRFRLCSEGAGSSSPLPVSSLQSQQCDSLCHGALTLLQPSFPPLLCCCGLSGAPRMGGTQIPIPLYADARGILLAWQHVGCFRCM